MRTPSTTKYAERNRKISQTMREKRARGEVIGRVPLGFKIVRDGNGNSKRVEDLEMQRLIQLASELRKQGLSIRKIAAVMAPIGLRTKAGMPVDSSSLHRILRFSLDRQVHLRKRDQA